MKIFFAHFFFFVFILLSEVSFLDILFPSLSAPVIILLSLFSWAFLVPFPSVLWKTIPLALLFDSITFSGGVVTLYSIPLVYLTGFLMRRLRADHRGSFMMLSFSLSFVGVIAFPLFVSFFSSGLALFSVERTEAIFLSFSSQPFLLLLFLCIPLFVVLSYSVNRFERYVQFISDASSRKIR